MRTYTALFVFVIFFLSCNTSLQKSASDPALSTTAAETDDLLGSITRADLQRAPFSEWFDNGYQSYQLDSAAIANIDLNEMEILTFMGTWCSDSQREIPHFYRILDEIDYPNNKMTLIAIDEDKANPEKPINEWSIEYVPTIIFIKNEKEIGRIVEAPAETLEKDMLQILEQ